MNEDLDASNDEISLTLIFNQDEDDEIRDRQARSLLARSREWDCVIDAQLATAPAPDGSRAGGMVEIGELIAKLTPTLLKHFSKQLSAWLKSARVQSVTLDIDGRKLTFPANTDPETLEKWVLAAQAEPKKNKKKK